MRKSQLVEALLVIKEGKGPEKKAIQGHSLPAEVFELLGLPLSPKKKDKFAVANAVMKQYRGKTLWSVYDRIKSFAKKLGFAWLSNETLADVFGMHPRTVKKNLERLVADRNVFRIIFSLHTGPGHPRREVRMMFTKENVPTLMKTLGAMGAVEAQNELLALVRGEEGSLPPVVQEKVIRSIKKVMPKERPKTGNIKLKDVVKKPRSEAVFALRKHRKSRGPKKAQNSSPPLRHRRCLSGTETSSKKRAGARGKPAKPVAAFLSPDEKVERQLRAIGYEGKMLDDLLEIYRREPQKYRNFVGWVKKIEKDLDLEDWIDRQLYAERHAEAARLLALRLEREVSYPPGCPSRFEATKDYAAVIYTTAHTPEENFIPYDAHDFYDRLLERFTYTKLFQCLPTPCQESLLRGSAPPDPAPKPTTRSPKRRKTSDGSLGLTIRILR